MDKNTITGLVLIGILLVGFSFLSRPSEEQIAAQKKYYDSIALVQQQEEALKAKTEAAIMAIKTIPMKNFLIPFPLLVMEHPVGTHPTVIYYHTRAHMTSRILRV